MRIRYPLCFTILSAATAIPALAQQEQLIAHTRCAVVDGRVALSRGLELAPIPIVGTKQEMAGAICDRTRHAREVFARMKACLVVEYHPGRRRTAHAL